MVSQRLRENWRALLAAASLAVLTLVPAALLAQSLPPAPSYPILVKFRNAGAVPEAGVAAPEVLALGGRLNLGVNRARPITPGLHAVEFVNPNAAETMEQILARLRADPAVQYAEPDQWRHAHVLPDDPLFVASSDASGQWYLQNPNANPAAPAASAIDAVDAWNITTGSSGLVIADLDTGVRFDHPDLLRAGAGGRLLPGYDFITNVAEGNESNGPNADASDPGDWVTATDLQSAPFNGDTGCAVANSSWHGTRVSGVLGAISNNDLGIAGATWSGWLLQVRVIGICGGMDSDIETGMLWAAGVPVQGYPTNPYPAQILNMSLGGVGSCPQSYQEIVNQLLSMGVLVVASAGNEGGPVDAPANCTGVAGVAGLRQIGTKVGFSNLGPQVALSAPAGNCVNASGACLFSIDTTYNVGTTTPEQNSYTNEYNTNLGTSFSAPMVSGIAGLMLSVNANLSPAQLIARLQQGATNPFPVNSAAPQCHIPASSSDDSQDIECNCTTSTCGAGMANALTAVQEAQRPIAAVTLPVSVSAGQPVTLNASTSAAACQRSIASYAWSVVSGSASLSGAATAQAMLQAPSSGSVTVQVVVTDNLGASDTAQVMVTSSTATSTAPASAGTKPCLTPITPVLPVTVTVSPTGPAVQAGIGSQAFTATVTSTANTAVTWEVNGVPGGNTSNGTITNAGLFMPPTTVPSNPVVTVTAVSKADAAASGFMGLTITPPVTVSVAPSSVTLLPSTGTQAFTATVSNTANTAVTWEVNGAVGGTSSTGTISNTGLFTAPAQIPASGSVTVSAVSAAESTSIGTASVKIAHAVVSIIPASVILLTGASQTFVASVSNTSNQTVSWFVNGVAGGNATVGTVSAGGLYQAPATVPSPASVTVTAVTAVDPGAAPGMAAVSLAAPAGSSSSSSSSGGSSSSGSSSSSSSSGGSTASSSGSGEGNSVSGATGTSSSGGGGAFDLWILLALGACFAVRHRNLWKPCSRPEACRVTRLSAAAGSQVRARRMPARHWNPSNARAPAPRYAPGSAPSSCQPSRRRCSTAPHREYGSLRHGYGRKRRRPARACGLNAPPRAPTPRYAGPVCRHGRAGSLRASSRDRRSAGAGHSQGGSHRA